MAASGDSFDDGGGGQSNYCRAEIAGAQMILWGEPMVCQLHSHVYPVQTWWPLYGHVRGCHLIYEPCWHWHRL